jgi:hypothetical protein
MLELIDFALGNGIQARVSAMRKQFRLLLAVSIIAPTVLFSVWSLGTRRADTIPKKKAVQVPVRIEKKAQLVPPKKPRVMPKPIPTVAPITPALRKKGYHECYPYDPIGMGPYRPYTPVWMGKMLVPQKGGHTADGGYDVVIHFHGHEPARKYLVQVAKGVVYVGLDFGINSGPYSAAMSKKERFEELLSTIERGLKRESGLPNAHIRHLALSGWSAGYGAVNEVLRHFEDKIDAAILLDGLHVRWKYGIKYSTQTDSVSEDTMQPIFDFAKKAVDGKKIFVFSHTQVDPGKYPSTGLSANLLLERFKLQREPRDPGVDPFGFIGEVHHNGFYLWSTAGKNEEAHCDHLKYIGKAVREVLEVAWDTPEMDRNVPPTPGPKPINNRKKD